MPRLTIDNREVQVPPGATVLDAARLLGIDIPTLCHREGCEPSTSCLVCMVKMGHNHRLVPSCGTPATEGMEIVSETEEVHQVRRGVLELLLSDHLGDCLAPCWFGCPANMDIPQMLRQIAAGELRAAIATVKADIALPAVLGRICPAPCERVCRRSGLDGAVTICQLKRFVADVDLRLAFGIVPSSVPYLPACQPATGRRVAVLGGGPSGLSAAYYLAQQGHAVTIFDENRQLGGRLRHESEGDLPRQVLDAEIATITALGIEVCADTRVGEDFPFAELGQEFEAVLVACGAAAATQAAGWGLSAGPHGIQVDRHTFRTDLPCVFAAGHAIRGGKGMVVRSVADGKESAVAMGQFLADQPIRGRAQPFSTKIGRMDQSELLQLSVSAGNAPRQEAADGYTAQQAVEQALRCLRCDCRALDNCKLREYAARYGADPRRYKAERRRFQLQRGAEVIHEPGKCIDCGLCIQIATAAGEHLGLTFIGRGFDVRVGVPLDHSLAEALTKAASECIAACPTAALAWRDQGLDKRLPGDYIE